MSNFFLKEISDVSTELENIGFDSTYKICASEKYQYKNIKIFGLTPAQANILKQTALSLGSDCAVHKDVITGKIEKSDVILGGSHSELKKIAIKLRKQPFKLALLSDEILFFLEHQPRTTKLVGILNITPDSFSDGGLYFNPNDACKHLISLINDGADMIDIGAESTRPDFEAVNSKEQIKRLKPVLEFIKKENIKTPFSIDTRNSEVADFALNNGAEIINDVSGFDFDKKMPLVITKYNAGVVIQHSAQITTNNFIEEIYFSLKKKIEYVKSIGVENIIVDPGIGFEKTKEENLVIIDRINELCSLKTPLMLGISRKSFLNVENLGNDNSEKDALTLAISYPLIKAGIDYLRVHNIKLHRKLIEIIK